jgi:hypothetical protein
VEFLTYLRAQWDRTIAVVSVFLGLLVLLIGWIGVSGADVVVKQLPYIMSGGIAGIIFVAIGAVMWISADLRDEWREIRQLRLHVADLLPAIGRDVEPVATPAAVPAPVQSRRPRGRTSVLAAASNGFSDGDGPTLPGRAAR